MNDNQNPTATHVSIAVPAMPDDIEEMRAVAVEAIAYYLHEAAAKKLGLKFLNFGWGTNMEGKIHSTASKMEGCTLITSYDPTTGWFNYITHSQYWADEAPN